MRRLAVLVTCAVALALCVQHAQAEVYAVSDMSAVLAGEVVPLTVPLGKLDSSWRRFTTQAEGGLESLYLGMLSPAANAAYTKGHLVSVGGESFLIAYRLPVDTASVAAMVRRGRAGAALPEITADTALVLSLLNLRTLGSLNAVKPVDVAAELAEYKRSGSFMQEMMSGGEEGGQEPNLRDLAMAVQMYATEYDALPPMESMDAAKAALIEYVPGGETFTDPMTGKPYGVNSSLSRKRVADIPDSASAVVFYQTQPGPDGMREVAFLDGHTQRVSDADWAKVKEQNGITE